MSNIDTGVNFNCEENQERCIHRDRALFEANPPYYCSNTIILYFVYRRNFGWTRYKRIRYNLNKTEQRDAFLKVLLDEGFIEKHGSKYNVLDPNYINFKNLEWFRLVYDLAVLKGKPLSFSECEKIDQRALKKMNKLVSMNKTNNDNK